MIKGIDISEWQSEIPSFDGEFIILRAGYSYTEDKKFKEHYKNAIKKGKRVGVYWYSYALNVEQAKKEARTCLELVKGLDIKMGIWFDMEDADGYKKKNGFGFTKLNISTICNAFCEIIESAGYYAGIYANYHYLTNYITCPAYDKWCAYWGSNDGKIPSGVESMLKNLGASMWQYTSKLNGKSQDGDVLLHNDIDMYNVQPSNNQNTTQKIDFDSMEKELNEKICAVIKDVLSKYRKE